jgi:hypothetical protein
VPQIVGILVGYHRTRNHPQQWAAHPLDGICYQPLRLS